MPIKKFLFSYVAQEEEYNEGEAIIKEGSRGDWVYLILQGRAKVKKMTSKGMVLIDTLIEGDIFGEMVLFQSGKVARSASVIADNYVKVGVLDTQRLIKEYESISPRLKSLIKSFIKRVADTTNKAVILAVETK